MTDHHDNVYALHILECIEDIERFLQGSEERFMKDDLVQNAVLRKLQIMAESSTRLPDRWKQRVDTVNWKALADFRNVLVHDYLGDIDLALVWSHIEKHLPILKKELQALLPEMEKKS